MSNFRITYKSHRGEPFYQARIITAKTVGKAVEKLGSYWTIRNITVQCNAETKAGFPCQRFSVHEKCSSHGGAS